MYEALLRDLRDAEAYGGDYAYMIGQAADAIEKLSKSPWIPVTERLPEDNIQVIVLSGIFVPFMEMAFYDGRWYSAWDGETEIEAVTHWMPLPEPPKE